MAATTTTLAELIVQLYKGPWVEALFTNTFLLARIGQKPGAGEGVRWPVRYAGNSSAGSYAEGDSGGRGQPGLQESLPGLETQQGRGGGLRPGASGR